MWAYIDETGNTGNHIFDPEQPLFHHCGVHDKVQFRPRGEGEHGRDRQQDRGHGAARERARRSRIETVAPDLRKVLKRADPRFFLSRLEKLYLAATKVVDTYFDQGENHAVPWHVYWIRPMRLMLTFKLARFVITEEIAQIVWKCVTANSEATSKIFFAEGARRYSTE
jgi:hypothetical protein